MSKHDPNALPAITALLGVLLESSWTDASDQDLADAIAQAQEAKYLLGTVESSLTAILGKRAGSIQGNLSDGRAFTLRRAQDRKEWDHEEWKRDARRVIVRQATDQWDAPEGGLVDTETGAIVPLGVVLQEVVTVAQEVHGSTAPRSTALKRLGLYASDYCASSPAGWRFNAIRPEDPATTTTEKD
jgi:hypothetical protein